MGIALVWAYEGYFYSEFLLGYTSYSLRLDEGGYGLVDTFWRSWSETSFNILQVDYEQETMLVTGCE